VKGAPAPPKRAEPMLVANFLPVRFRGSAFKAGVVPFSTSEQVASLRDELKGTHVVRRDGDRVVCVPVVPDASEVGKQEKFVIGENRSLTMRLVREALIGQVVAMRYKLSAFAQPAFVSRYPQHDLLAQAAGDQRGALAALHVYPKYKLDSRVSGPASQPGVIVGLKTRCEIDLTVAELMALGVDVEGRYVLAETGEVPFNPDLDEHVYRRLAGAVESVRDGRLYLRDAPVVTEVEAGKAWLEGRWENLQDVMAALTGGRHARVLEMLEEAKFGLLGADGRLNRITALARRLAAAGPLKIANGVDAEVGLPVGSEAGDGGGGGLQSAKFSEPAFVFDPGGDKTDKSAQRGLAEFGPFDSEFFTPRRPRITVLTPRAFQGTAEVFMDRFRRGVPDSKVYAQGFARKYRLADCDVIVEPFDAGPRDAAAYRAACLAVAGAPDRPHLAIVITSEEQEALQGDDSPYLVAKSTLMGQGIPVQELQVETIRRADPAPTLDTIALQCYAKLGGIPFVIAAPRTIAHELVIGIGSAHVRPSRFADPERVVGITTVFSADGNYILSNMSREADYEQYPEELLRALRGCIDDVKKRNAWQPEDAIRLIFHVFKPLKETEAEAVKRLVSGLLSEFRSVEFAFVHVSDEHDWALFDTTAPGLGNWRMPSGSRMPKARSVPQRGYAVTVSHSEILLTVTGPYDMKVPTQGLPRPLLLRLHPASTFTDIEYLAGQAFRFTALSWRRFYPSGTPVTILYSDLIASLLGRLRHVRNWNADVLSTSFRTSRWFL
jgi:Piwi domain